MTEKAEQPLNGQQLSAIQKQMQDRLAVLVKDVELRKWSVDQACGLAGAAVEHGKKDIDVVTTARQIHAFLTEEVRDTAGPNQV
jgi:hypothetical protein